jgi:acyl-CoA thioesterase
MGNRRSLLERLRKAHRKCAALMPIGETLGFKVESIEVGSAAVTMDVDERHANVLGATHGGLSFVLADTAMGLAHLGLLADGEAGATVEVKINFLRPTWHTRLRAEARTVQHGDTLSLLECNVCDADGRLVARAMATMMRLAKGAGEGRNAVYEG